MKDERPSIAEATARRVIGLEEEVEASGFAVLDESSVAWLRQQLHNWVDTVTGSIVSPGLGRVTLIHDAGRESIIASPQLAFAMSRPVAR